MRILRYSTRSFPHAWLMQWSFAATRSRSSSPQMLISFVRENNNNIFEISQLNSSQPSLVIWFLLPGITLRRIVLLLSCVCEWWLEWTLGWRPTRYPYNYSPWTERSSVGWCSSNVFNLNGIYQTWRSSLAAHQQTLYPSFLHVSLSNNRSEKHGGRKHRMIFLMSGGKTKNR